MMPIIQDIESARPEVTAVKISEVLNNKGYQTINGFRWSRQAIEYVKIDWRNYLRDSHAPHKQINEDEKVSDFRGQISTRLALCLRRNGINTWSDVRKCTQDDLRRLPYLGAKSLCELNDIMAIVQKTNR